MEKPADSHGEWFGEVTYLGQPALLSWSEKDCGAIYTHRAGQLCYVNDMTLFHFSKTGSQNWASSIGWWFTSDGNRFVKIDQDAVIGIDGSRNGHVDLSEFDSLDSSKMTSQDASMY